MKEETNNNAFSKLTHIQPTPAPVESAPSERYDTPAEVASSSPSSWTPKEQTLLEQALKTYPSSLGSERWDRIAECIEGRSKKEVVDRIKELTKMLKEKRDAERAVAKK